MTGVHARRSGHRPDIRIAADRGVRSTWAQIQAGAEPGPWSETAAATIEA